MVTDKEDIAGLLAQIDQKKPDLVEFRLDTLSDYSTVEKIAELKQYPAIATIKSKRDDAKKLLLGAASSGFEFVDVGLTSSHVSDFVKELKVAGTEVIVSFHDNSKTPEPKELKRILKAEMKAGGDVSKIVTTAVDEIDNLSVLSFLKDKPAGSRVVTFAMGRQGILSRILSPVFGAEFTFASLNEFSKTADGQLTIDNLRSAWQLLGVQ
jgi:3-dehydroquinate dehydratase-1